MTRKYVKKETVTIIRTEEVSIEDDNITDSQISNAQLGKAIWMFIKKYLFSYKWIGGKDDGQSNNDFF